MTAHFRLLADNAKRDPIADWDDGVELEPVICPVEPMHRRAGRRLTPLSLQLKGSRVDDFVWTWMSELLVTDHVAEIFRSYGLTGYNLLPASARFASNQASRTPPRLWEVQVTGWAGLAKPESGIRLLEQTACCGHLRYSGCSDPTNLIDEAMWDGSDIFIVWPLPRFPFLSGRAVRAIMENEFTGAILLELQDMNSTDGYSPGRLSYWMPLERAKALGEPLGIY